MAYTRQPNYFVDPAGIGPGHGIPATYTWYINHSTEEEVQNSRQMADGAPSSNIGLIPQQGVPFPLVFQWKGTLFRQQDKDAMDAWYALCDERSIYLKDFDANQYEVLITDWSVMRRPVAWNHRGGVPWLWNYTITIRVLTVLSGDWSNV